MIVILLVSTFFYKTETSHWNGISITKKCNWEGGVIIFLVSPSDVVFFCSSVLQKMLTKIFEFLFLS